MTTGGGVGGLEAAIQEELEKFWQAQAISVDAEGDNVDDLVAAMDSLTASEVLGALEELTGIELPSADLIRRGGYDNKEQFIRDLTTSVLDYAKEHK